MHPLCVVCGGAAKSRKAKICDKVECSRTRASQKSTRYQLTKRRAARPAKTPLVRCEVCLDEFDSVTVLHLKRHGLTMSQYRARYPGVQTMSAYNRDRCGHGSPKMAQHHAYRGKPMDDRLFEFLTGTLLGDASLEQKSKRANARYAEGGCNRQYIEWKTSFLSCYFPTHFKERWSKPDKRTGKSYRGFWLRTGVHPILTTWRAQWYQAEKSISRALVEKYLTAFALAVWFADDGHLGTTENCAYLYTLAFTTSDVRFLQKTLRAKFGIITRLRHNKKHQPFLYVGAAARLTLLRVIGSYLPPGMEYKCRAFGFKASNAKRRHRRSKINTKNPSGKFEK